MNSIKILILVCFSVITNSVFADGCESLLDFTLAQLDPPIWNVSNGWSNRGALGNQPSLADKANEEAASNQGIIPWGVSIAVAKSIPEARQHDSSHKFKNTGKVPYVITDIDVSDFNKDTPKEVVQARLKQILASGAKIIEFEDAQKENGKKIPAENYNTLSVDDFLKLGVMDSVFWFDLDERGPRFHFFTWAFPKLRGVVVFDDLFKRNESGAIEDRNLRRMFRDLIDLYEVEGATVSFNTNPIEALTMAREQWRVGKDKVTMVQNSQLKINPNLFQAYVRKFEAGTAISVEVRNKDGELVAGEILSRVGNMLHPFTIFHWVKGQDKLNPERTYAGWAKAASIAEAIRFRRHVPLLDVGMVSPLTEEEGGKVISGEEFLTQFRSLNSQPPFDFELQRPFSLDELPFPKDEISIWVPPRQEPPPAKPKVIRPPRVRIERPTGT